MVRETGEVSAVFLAEESLEVFACVGRVEVERFGGRGGEKVFARIVEGEGGYVWWGGGGEDG